MAKVKQVVVTKNTTTKTRRKVRKQSSYKCPVCGTTIKK